MIGLLRALLGLRPAGPTRRGGDCGAAHRARYAAQARRRMGRAQTVHTDMWGRERVSRARPRRSGELRQRWDR